MDYAVEIPKLGSLILKHSFSAPFEGLDTVPEEDQPPVTMIFFSFRVMVGIGFAMLGVGVWSLYRRAKGGLYEDKWLHRCALLMGPSGFIAVLAGWITTEVGRQPWTVYGLLRTSESVLPGRGAGSGDISCGLHHRLFLRLWRRSILYPAADEPSRRNRRKHTK